MSFSSFFVIVSSCLGLSVYLVNAGLDSQCWAAYSRTEASSFLSNGKRSTPKDCCDESRCESRGSACYTEQHRQYLIHRYGYVCPAGQAVKVDSWCPGHTGRDCTDVCSALGVNRCMNGGTCCHNDQNWLCSCRPGYVGTLCQTDIKECLSNPCNPTTSTGCQDLVNDYRCHCKTGYTGHECSQEINECASNPCMNSGRCVDHLNGYTCVCAPGFEGTHCEIDKNECVSSPCQNGATCINLPGMYNCTCTRDHAGNNCHKDLFPPRDQVCRPGKDTSCYIVFRVTDTWQGAKEFCEARNGHLAVPDDDDEELYIENYLESMRVRYPETVFWIGGQKSGLDRIQWVSGNRITVQRWPTGTSDIVTGTQCMSMDGSYKFQWQAYPCDRQSYFVCEESVPYPQFVG